MAAPWRREYPDESDVRGLQKLGELFQKSGNNQEAARYFRLVAAQYARDGLFLKSLALTKQCLKLDPALVDLDLKLAELHQQLGLTPEARAYLVTARDEFARSGNAEGLDEANKRLQAFDERE